MRRILVSVAAVVCVTVGLTQARKPPPPVPTAPLPSAVGPFDAPASSDARFAIAAANTTVLASYTFDSGSACDPQGWTVVDATAQIGTFWHVDDFAGVNVNPGDSLAVLAGSKSLWCGVRASATGPTCGYVDLPGYGNDWNQTWQTKACVSVSGDLDVSFLMSLDSEAYYDAAVLEYSAVCNAPKPLSQWTRLDGGLGVWDGLRTITHDASYPVSGTSVRVRFRFFSDGGYSDEDGFFDSHAGPVVIDDLVVEGLAMEDFEGEPVGATSTEDWEGDVIPGYGASYMALLPGGAQLQIDNCVRDLSCLWAATFGSPETYACGGYPQQAAVPKANSEGQYINAEIWSPLIPLSGSGARTHLTYSLYRDDTLDALVFSYWEVRSLVEGCETNWRSYGFVIIAPQRGWRFSNFSVGHLVPSDATHIQLRLGIIDMCGVWCGVFGTGACHSNGPLLDNVRVYRVDIVGPTYSTRDIDMFQDTFPSDGTDTGIGRADMARSITVSSSPTIMPGDSVTLTCVDLITAVIPSNRSGLADDLALGGKQIYLWVHVIDSGVPSATKTGAALTDTPASYPFKDTQVAGGKIWTRIRCRLNNAITSQFAVDLNDNLFEAGDVIEFFFGATNTLGQTSYCSGSALTFVQSDLDLAAATASEFTILPLDPGGGGNDILYVDGMDGRGAQGFFDTAFEQMGLTPDRYDVRGPTSSVANRPASRVTNVAAQLNANYAKILWDAGDLTQSLGDGTGTPEKSNDYSMVNTFLAGLSSAGGIYVAGDDYLQLLNAALGASALIFKSTYLPFTLSSGNHRSFLAGAPIAPIVMGAGGAFGSDTWVAYGGCPLLNDFDVVTPTGGSVIQSTYGPAAGNNGAEISKITGNARVLAGGFSFIYIRDDDEDGVRDASRHLYDILVFLGNDPPPPTDAPVAFTNRLEQNYPNPFNPTTTIAFSLKERGRVRVEIYDVAGEHVRTLLDEVRAAGSHTDTRWDGTDSSGTRVASGVYFYRLTAGSFSQTRKMVLLR